jgi:hypothetical protein
VPVQSPRLSRGALSEKSGWLRRYKYERNYGFSETSRGADRHFKVSMRAHPVVVLMVEAHLVYNSCCDDETDPDRSP